jgi:hypothetical protein
MMKGNKSNTLSLDRGRIIWHVVFNPVYLEVEGLSFGIRSQKERFLFMAATLSPSLLDYHLGCGYTWLL